MAPLFTGLKLGGFGKNPDVASSASSFILGSLANNTNPFGDNSCVALYKLDNSTSNSVSGSYGLTATGGVPVFTSQGVATDGVTKYFFDATPKDTKFNISGTPTGYPFSVSAWIWVPSSIGWGSGMGPGLKELLNANISGQRVSTGIVDWSSNSVNEWTIMYGNTNHWTFAPSSTPTNQWIHIVFSIVNSNDSGHRLYQDGGSALAASNRGGGHGGTPGWQLGGNSDIFVENANYYIDQVRIFNKALSQSEANNLYLNDRSFYNITTAAR
jgi:hypothetical protein